MVSSKTFSGRLCFSRTIQQVCRSPNVWRSGNHRHQIYASRYLISHPLV